MLYSNFNQQVWYTPLSERTADRPTRFLLKTIPYRFLSIKDLALSNNKEFRVEPLEYLLKTCITDYENITTNVDKQYILNNLPDILPRSIIMDIYSKLLELFTIDSKTLKEIKTTIEFMLDDRYSGSNWQCATCQKRGLDKHRNCPFIPREKHDPSLRLPFMGENVNECPAKHVNQELSRILIEGYNMLESHIMPENGSLGDQPILFVIGSMYVTERIKYYNSKKD